jgi:hypothetical protein
MRAPIDDENGRCATQRPSPTLLQGYRWLHGLVVIESWPFPRHRAPPIFGASRKMDAALAKATHCPHRSTLVAKGRPIKRRHYCEADGLSGSMPIRSLTAKRNFCFEPRYCSVVWIETCPSRNWIWSSSPPARWQSLGMAPKIMRRKFFNSGTLRGGAGRPPTVPWASCLFPRPNPFR